MAAMRLNIPTVFVSGGPMEAGRWNNQNIDLITAMVKGADKSVSLDELNEIEEHACPGCGCCSGMFTANSMNSSDRGNRSRIAGKRNNTCFTRQ